MPILKKNKGVGVLFGRLAIFRKYQLLIIQDKYLKFLVKIPLIN